MGSEGGGYGIRGRGEGPWAGSNTRETRGEWSIGLHPLPPATGFKDEIIAPRP